MMKRSAVFASVFGLTVGDVVRTSYGSGPYTITELTRPAYTWFTYGGFVVRTWPVFSLFVSRTPTDQGYIINDIRRLDDGRYFTDSNDEVTVIEQAGGRTLAQMSLFAADDQIRRPWPDDFMIDGVVFPWAWACLDHHEYLGPILDPKKPAICPECRRPASSQRVMELMPRPEPPARPEAHQRNQLLLSLNERGLRVHPELVATRAGS